MVSALNLVVWRRARWDAQPWLEERMGYGPEDDDRRFRDGIARENDVWLAVEGDDILGLLAIAGSSLNYLYVEPRRQGAGVGKTVRIDLNCKAFGQHNLIDALLR